MDLDRALFAARKPALRIYGWKRRAVSLGYFQKQEEVRRRLPNDWKEAPIVMRPTGGGAVLHTEEETTFSLILSASSLGNPLFSYRTIHEAAQRALHAVGIRTEWAQSFHKRKLHPLPLRERGSSPEGVRGAGTFCFMAPTPGDILLGGQKIVGGAQRRSRGWLLHQGSIQLPVPSRGLREALAESLARMPALWYI